MVERTRRAVRPVVVAAVEEVRIRYPERAGVIEASEDSQVFDFEKMQMEPAGNQTVYWEFFHKRTKAMPQGKYLVFTEQALLHNSDYPYSHTALPCVRFTDIDRPSELHGVSFFETVKQLTGAYNNLTNMILRNQIMASHPKWMVQAGTAKIEALGNDITVVQYKGPVAPQLVQSNPTPSEVFAFRDELKAEFEAIAGVGGVTRGEPPQGIKAGVALQFLAEQENERFNENILKWNEFIKKVALMTIAVAGDYYDASDERMVRVLGKDKSWMTMSFDQAHLSKDYDIRVQQTSALPRSVAARTQTLLDLNERFPELFSDEQVLEMLDMAQSEKFTNMATASVMSAEAENEAILSSEKLTEPEIYEDHVNHWNIHVKMMRSYSFKNQTPPKTRSQLEDHVLVHEMFMVKQGQKNPQYAEKLLTLEGFPIFFTPENEQIEQIEAQEEQAAQSTGGQEAFTPEQGLNVNQPQEQPEVGFEDTTAQVPQQIPVPVDQQPTREV